MGLISLFRSSRALAARIEETRAPLYRVAYAWCHNRALADDLVQDTLVRALEHADKLRDPERLRGWLFGILANRWKDHLRSLRPTVDIDALDEECFVSELTPEIEYGRVELAFRVQSAIALLPMGQRQVLTLVDLEEFSYAEVAAIVRIPIGTVMSRLSRARLALREQLLQSGLAQVAHLRSAK
jgi:RNA polymerase sigma-70 factor (ECF subfamily)